MNGPLTRARDAQPDHSFMRGGHILGDGDTRIRGFFKAACDVLCPPPTEPASLEVLNAIHLGIKAVLEFLPDPTVRVREYQELSHQAYLELRQQLGSEHISTPSALKGKRTDHPAWVGFAELADPKPENQLRLLMAGCAFLIAMWAQQEGNSATGRSARRKPRVSVEDARSIRFAPQESAMTKGQITEMLLGRDIDRSLDLEWVVRMRRLWREVIRLYSSSPPPEQSPEDKVRGQLLSSALNDSAAHTGGAVTHRNLTTRQMTVVFQQVKADIAADRLSGALALLVLRTGLSAPVLCDLPVIDSLATTPSTSLATLDIRLGLVRLDLSIIAHQAAQSIPGAIEADYQLHVRLPTDLANHLRRRAQQRPATRLKDLYPEDIPPQESDLAIATEDEIAPTWSRLRYSLGPFLRARGMNNLLAGLLSGDFSMFPRSKLHYATVTDQEFSDQEAHLYQLIGLASPVRIDTPLAGFGCRVTPSQVSVVAHDLYLTREVEQLRPGPRTPIKRLLEFHNAYTGLCGWRLSILLGLRESQHIDVDASARGAARWLAVHDKTTQADRGLQPVPLCNFALGAAHLYKTHCAALARRLQMAGLGNSEVCRYAASVGGHGDLRMLFIVKNQVPLPLRSNDFTRQRGGGIVMPADVGRKVLENLLREHNMPSVQIDDTLRHFKSGQERSSAFNAQTLTTFVRRLTPVLDKIADTLFGQQVVGLSRS